MAEVSLSLTVKRLAWPASRPHRRPAPRRPRRQRRPLPHASHSRRL